MKFYIIFLCLTFLMNSCRTSNKKAFSVTQYSIFPPNESFKTLLGMIEAVEQDFSSQMKQIKVCIGKGSSGYSQANLALEYKIALIAWLSASEHYTESVLDFFQFDLQENCVDKADSYQNLIYINPGSENNNGKKTFDPVITRCVFDVLTAETICNYSHTEIVYGVGGGSVISVNRYVANKDKWAEVKVLEPSRLYLSPHVKFHSLKQEINKNNQIDKDVKERFSDLYDQALASDQHPYHMLLNLVNILNEVNVLSTGINHSNDFQTFQNEGFDKTTQDSLRKTWSHLINLVNQDSGGDSYKKKQLNHEYEDFIVNEERLQFGVSKQLIDILNQVYSHNPPEHIQSTINQLVRLGSITRSYQKTFRKDAYTTILHELGHQLGMDHAHVGSRELITGNLKRVVSVPGDGRQPYVTKDSTMATLAKAPYSLTQNDDVPGIKLLIRLTHEYFERRKKGLPEPGDIINP